MTRHIPVLLHEVIDGLDLKEGDTFLDATLGDGGHSLEICKILDGSVRIIGLELDGEALEKSRERLESAGCQITLFAESFRNAGRVLEGGGVSEINKALFDLGLRTGELEDSGRGFSFQRDEPLIMTFKDQPLSGEVTAKDVVNDWQGENLLAIIKGFGEERYAGRIVRAILESRDQKSIETSRELSGIIEKAVPASYRRGRIHPATRTFQAIRMAVNDELGALREGLREVFEKLAIGGRMAVISFHSLEDREVKNFFREKAKSGEGTLIVKKPVVASDGEIKENPRARSAKLRILEKNH